MDAIANFARDGNLPNFSSHNRRELEFIVTRALMGTDREHLEFPNMILIAHDSLEATAVPRQNIATSFGAGL
jgi:hypothetical protein